MTTTEDLILMIDTLCACIETGTLPEHGSDIHQRARRMVDESGMMPNRERSPLLYICDSMQRCSYRKCPHRQPHMRSAKCDGDCKVVEGAVCRAPGWPV